MTLTWDEDKAAHAIDFIETGLKHVKGKWATDPFILEPWQLELVSEIFGTLNEKGKRAYRTVYCEVPRKNGKTTLAAAILLYMLFCDHEHGAEVYSAASTREQASIVYNIASQMVKKNDDLNAVCDIRPSNKRLIFGDRVYVACSSDAGAPHGTSPHCVIFDEMHLQKTRLLWEAFQTGLGARAQPLIFVITTAGHDRSSICWELHQYAKAVDRGEIEDETFLPCLFGSDPQDDWTDPKVWAKANPCLGVSLSVDFIAQQCKLAKENPATENSFRRLHLNQWTEQESRVIPMRAWDECEQKFTAEDLRGRLCHAGLDLSSTRDVTAFVLVFPEPEGGVSVLPWFWIPEANVDERAAADQRLLRGYGSGGFLEMTPGNEVDVIFVAERIMQIVQEFNCQIIGFDGWNAAGPTQLLKERGLPEQCLKKMPQSFSTYNAPFKQLVAWVGNGKFRHDGNPVLRWMASNTAAIEDPSGNIRPDKGNSADKIDGICATLMGMALAMTHGIEASPYNTKGEGAILL